MPQWARLAHDLADSGPRSAGGVTNRAHDANAPNLSDQPRTLYITTYYAEDAIELSPNHLPSKLTHELVRGEASGRVRCTPYEMALPAVPKATSFFAQQEGADMG